MTEHAGVLIAVSAAETGRFTDFWDALFHVTPVGRMSVAVERGANIARNRNALTALFLKSSCEWIWYLDDDSILRPDALVRLMAHGKDVVSGLYVSRQAPFTPHVYDREDEAGHVSPMRVNGEGLVPCLAVGAGCLLVHRRLVERLEPPYWRLGQIQADEWGDDIDWCRRVRDAGHEIWCDLECRVGHKSQATLWPDRRDGKWGTTVVTANTIVGHLPYRWELL